MRRRPPTKQLAAEALLAARYMLIEASTCLEDREGMNGWRTRQKQLDREIEKVLNAITAGMGDK